MTPERQNPLNRKSDRRGGFYYKENDPTPYSSVTEVLKVLDKPALFVWGQKEMWRAMAANPYLSWEEAQALVRQISDSAKARGSTIHDIVEAYEHTRTYIDNIPEQFRGYANAFYRFVEEHPLDILEHERTVYSERYHYAGTLDLLIRLNGAALPVVADIKTGKAVYIEAFLQLSAYRQALKEAGVETAGIAVILLQEDGSYQYHFTPTDSFAQFLACKQLFDWMNAEDIAKTKEAAKAKAANPKPIPVQPEPEIIF